MVEVENGSPLFFCHFDNRKFDIGELFVQFSLRF